MRNSQVPASKGHHRRQPPVTRPTQTLPLTPNHNFFFFFFFFCMPRRTVFYHLPTITTLDVPTITPVVLPKKNSEHNTNQPFSARSRPSNTSGWPCPILRSPGPPDVNPQGDACPRRTATSEYIPWPSSSPPGSTPSSVHQAGSSPVIGSLGVRGRMPALVPSTR